MKAEEEERAERWKVRVEGEGKGEKQGWNLKVMPI